MSILVGGMCSIYCHMALVLAFMLLYSISKFLFFVHFVKYILLKKYVVLKCQTETVNESACFVFLCFCNPPNSDMDYRIFNVRT